VVAETKQTKTKPKVADANFLSRVAQAHPGNTAEAMKEVVKYGSRKRTWQRAAKVNRPANIDPKAIPQSLWVSF
jgi:hypothetical protein